MMMIMGNTDTATEIDGDIDQLEIDAEATKVQIDAFPARIAAA